MKAQIISVNLLKYHVANRKQLVQGTLDSFCIQTAKDMSRIGQGYSLEDDEPSEHTVRITNALFCDIEQMRESKEQWIGSLAYYLDHVEELKSALSKEELKDWQEYFFALSIAHINLVKTPKWQKSLTAQDITMHLDHSAYCLRFSEFCGRLADNKTNEIAE